MLPKAPPARRTVLAAFSLVLAVIGAQLYTAFSDGGLFFLEVWLPILLVSVVPPALGVLLHGRRAQRWVCLLGAVLTALMALVLFAYGYGIYQIPAVVALAMAGATRG